MYWSVYETLLLITGILTAGIAAIPIPTIPARTRMIAGMSGAGLILLALILGNVSTFTYPSLILAAPLFPLLAGGAIAKSALDKQKQSEAEGTAGGSLHYDEAGVGVSPPPASAVSATPSPADASSAAVPPATSGPIVVPPQPPVPVADPRQHAWQQVHDPSTPGERLAAIGAHYPEFAGAISDHANAYPELRAWARAVAAEPQS